MFEGIIAEFAGLQFLPSRPASLTAGSIHAAYPPLAAFVTQQNLSLFTFSLK
nr:hypothetical protein [uncultured Treponema sp.]